MFVLSNTVKKNILVNCDHGTMIVNRFDSNFESKGHGQWLLDHGNVSTLEATVTLKTLKRQDAVIFDIGANIGTYATILAKSLPLAKIFCFEPQRLVYQMLCGNFAINNYDNCYPYNVALGDKSCVIDVAEPNYYSNNDFGLFSLTEEKIPTSGNYYTLEVLTLDDFVNKFSIKQIDFVKVDVEGMDLAVLKGGKHTLSKFSPALLVEYNNTQQDMLKEIIDYLGQDNYTFEVIHNNLLAVPK